MKLFSGLPSQASAGAGSAAHFRASGIRYERGDTGDNRVVHSPGGVETSPFHMDAHPLTRNEAIRLVQAVEPDIRRLGVRRLALFGSVVRDEARPDSDVDVLVEFIPSEKTFDRFMALADLLESVFGRRVELVTTEALSPYIGPHILAEAMDVVRAA